jgi:hypothetical protein
VAGNKSYNFALAGGRISFRLRGRTTMKIKTKVKAGSITHNHNQTRRIRIKSGIKAGGVGDVWQL